MQNQSPIHYLMAAFIGKQGSELAELDEKLRSLVAQMDSMAYRQRSTRKTLGEQREALAELEAKVQRLTERLDSQRPRIDTILRGWVNRCKEAVGAWRTARGKALAYWKACRSSVRMTRRA